MVDVNQGLCSLLGYARQEMGKTPFEFVDKAHNVVDANQFGLDMLGYSKNEMPALNAEDILHPDDSKDVPPDSTHSRILQGEIVDIERRYRTKSGVYLPVRVSMRRMREVLGKGSYMEATGGGGVLKVILKWKF